MLRQIILALAVPLSITSCRDGTEPSALPMHVVITGTVHDSTGLPLIGALIAYTSYGEEPPTVQTDNSGSYRATVRLIPEAKDSLLIRAIPPGCAGDYPPPSYVNIADRGQADSVYVVDFTFPTAAPRPSPEALRLCAQDRHPTSWLNYSTILMLDSAQYLPTGTETFVGGSWDHHTSGSTIGDTGTFTGVVTTSFIVLTLTYDILHPACGSTQQLQGVVLPNGQWGALQSVSPSACPVATLRLAFAPY